MTNATRYPDIIATAALYAIAPRYAVQMRIRYLSERIVENNAAVLAMPIDNLSPESSAYWDLVADATAAENDKLRREIESLRYAMSGKKRDGEITDDMISRAKEYPIDRLIEFDRTGSSIAWCHPDKSPSLKRIKGKEKARCHVCAKMFNAVDVLMERDHMSFVDAVRSLN